MSNLIQESDQGSMSHRSLGGHVRCHVTNSTDHHHQHQKKKKKQMKKLSSVNNGGLNSSDLGYELRKDPKKTQKVKDSSEVEVNGNCLDKLCKECGKGFRSWKALFGHMKCHSEKVSTKHNLNQDSWAGYSENENSKKSRSRNKRIKRHTVTCTTTTTTITTASSSISMNGNNHASTSIVSEIEQDQESEIAMCLIMLSRDEGKWGHEIEGKKPTGNSSKINKIGEIQIGATELEKIVIQNDDKMELSKKKFECVTCNKSFHSYQALGGHKASHKKLKESLDSKPEDNNNEDDTVGKKPFCAGSLRKTAVHECPICLKVFSSGQALGGHKRSHMIAEAKLINQQTSMDVIEEVKEPVREIRGFIDLNMLPDTMEEDMIMNSGGTAAYKPWHWVDTTNRESTTLLGLLSTS